jgi:hypothetical protein
VWGVEHCFGCKVESHGASAISASLGTRAEFTKRIIRFCCAGQGQHSRPVYKTKSGITKRTDAVAVLTFSFASSWVGALSRCNLYSQTQFCKRGQRSTKRIVAGFQRRQQLASPKFPILHRNRFSVWFGLYAG